MDPDSAKCHPEGGEGARRSPGSPQGPIPKCPHVAAEGLEAPLGPWGRAQQRLQPGTSEMLLECSLASACARWSCADPDPQWMESVGSGF